MLNSLFTETRKHGAQFKINLLGILNYVTLSELIRRSEILTDHVTGEVTIKETVTGNNISAIADPMNRDEALRKAIYDSVLVTTTYRAAKAVSLPDLTCSQTHFALHQKTNQQTVGDYLNWFVALGLLTKADKAAFLAKFTDGGLSTCVLRTSFTDTDCLAMFFDAAGELRPRKYYLEFGRLAMRALLDPQHNANDALRYQVVDDALWPQAAAIGANDNLGPLVGLSTADPRVGFLIGDVYVIAQWADTMTTAGEMLAQVREFVGEADPAGLFENPEFKKKTDALQKKMASMVKASKTRFDEPWGMVSLFWAGGSPPTVYGKAVAGALTIEKGAQPALAAGAVR